MLQLPVSVHAQGQSLTTGATAGTDIIACIQGVTALADLTVGTDVITVGVIGTSANY